MLIDPESGDQSKGIDNHRTGKLIRTTIRRKWRSAPNFIKCLIFVSLFAMIFFVLLILISFPSQETSHNVILEKDFNIMGRESRLPEMLIEKKVKTKRPPDPLAKPDRYNEQSKEAFNNELNQNINNNNNNQKDINRDEFGPIEWEKELKIPLVKLNHRQQEVIVAMKHSWDGYRRYAWGADHLKPITKSQQNWFHVGLTILDSIDTLLIMGLEKEYKDALEWIEKDLSFDTHNDVNCFEMTIRSLGGLLSAYHLTKNPILLNKAIDLGDRLIHCFDSPSSKIPYSDVNLKSRKPKSPAWSPDSSLSEVSTVQLEFRDLTRLTSDKRYEIISFRASQHIHNLTLESHESLLPMYINPVTGRLTPSTITMGARSDSYYEYLLKQYLQTGISWLRDDYIKAMNEVKIKLLKTTNGPLKLTFVGEILRGSSMNLHPKMDHLVCFLPGTLALGYYHFNKNRPAYRGMVNFAEEVKDDQEIKNEDVWPIEFADHLAMAESLARTCYSMYNLTATGLSPEIAYFGTQSGDEEFQIRPADSHNLLRPEYVESLFYLYHITENEMYREQGWKIFNSFKKHCFIDSGGFTSIGDVRNIKNTRPRDMQESFWLAETLKYLFLLFSDDKILIKKLLNSYIINTEAHLIPRAIRLDSVNVK